MADFIKIAKLFEDRVEGINFYETRATIRLKNELLHVLYNETRQLIFLVGEPGSGKSVFLNKLSQILQDFEIIKFNTPFFEPVDFVKTLLERKNIHIQAFSLEEMIAKAVKHYQNSKTIIAIDEAQLLSKDMIELLRILADSKAFWFILAMHKHESGKILQEPQFASRPHKILVIQKIEDDEVREFIFKELFKEGEYLLHEEEIKFLSKKIHKYTKGNFRDTKKILHKIFLLMDEATKLGKKGYEKPNSCLITMAAIAGGMLRV